MSKSLLGLKIAQLFCRHRWTIKEWWPLDKEGKKLFKDIGLLNSCEKCGKFSVLCPNIPKDCTISISGKAASGMSECSASFNERLLE